MLRPYGLAPRIWRQAGATRNSLLEFQRRAVARLTRRAALLPYYRDLLGRSLRLSDLPVTRKADLRRLPASDYRLAAGNGAARGLVRHLTSGSTGEPFTILRTRTEEDLLLLFRARAWREFGVRPRDRTAIVREPHLGGPARTTGRRLAGILGLYRFDTVDCRQDAAAIRRDLEGLAPDVVGGYPSALALVAPGLAERLRPRVVWSGGETLEPAARRRIEAGFGRRPFNLYGTHECNVVAWECARTGLLHTCDDNVIVEVLRQDGGAARQGESGEVVITCLHSEFMPLIRYALGDIAMRGPEPCPCGQPFATLVSVEGRLADYFHLADGRVIHPYAITGPLLTGSTDWIDRHQLVQEAPDRVVLRLAVNREPAADELDRLGNVGAGVLGAATRFEIERVERLAPDASGKFRSYRAWRAEGRS